MNPLNCPACASEQTQRLSAIVDSGTSYTRGTSVGGFGGIAGGRVGGFGGLNTAVHNSTTRSSLAARLAAPIRRSTKRFYVLGGLAIYFSFAAFHASFLLFLLLLIGGGFLIFTGYKNSTFNKMELPLLFSRWSASFYCNRCQNVYIPAGFAHATSGPVIDAGRTQSSFPNADTGNRLR